MFRNTGKSSIFKLGVPFMAVMVLGTYGMAELAQLRYDYNDSKTRMIAKKEELQIEADRKPFNIQEEYFKLTSTKKDWDDWDMVRVKRPDGEE